MAIPLVDLQIQHRQVAVEIEAGFARVLREGSFILGSDVADFERAFAEFSGVAHCIGVANGTDALELALRALGVGPGDEVILPVNTFIATALAVARAGASPAFVDCDESTGLIDVDAVEAAVGDRTRALLPVHLYGQMAPMAALEAIARRRDLLLLEDAAQCQGARQSHADGERPAGSLGVAAGTSFYPGKNLGAYGDAGAVLTRDDELASRVRELRNYGSERKYQHPRIGFNSRLDTLQAVVLNAKLAHLDDWNEQRRQAAARYDALLGAADGVVLPTTLPGNTPVWHLYVVRVAQRDAVLDALHSKGIAAGIHYPFPLHLTGAFEGSSPRGAFPVAERLADEILSLPLFPGITAQQQEEVARALIDSLA
ncbi:MAG: DegT/DnrJ/EryC1/StrS family aminotransferase [Myxococcota bacterium]|nr:DegT/DnrJ/EryC1/StrS family aminotransferase [Myxococcota bacterium]